MGAYTCSPCFRLSCRVWRLVDARAIPAGFAEALLARMASLLHCGGADLFLRPMLYWAQCAQTGIPVAVLPRLRAGYPPVIVSDSVRWLYGAAKTKA